MSFFNPSKWPSKGMPFSVRIYKLEYERFVGIVLGKFTQRNSDGIRLLNQIISSSWKLLCSRMVSSRVIHSNCCWIDRTLKMDFLLLFGLFLRGIVSGELLRRLKHILNRWKLWINTSSSNCFCGNKGNP